MAQTLERGKALVVGAGIAGLLTARVLSDYYQEVIIVERDRFLSKPNNRPGVPQSFHPHRVLPRGHMILERYFAGYIDELLDMGAYPSHEERTSIVNKYGSLEIQPPVKNAASSRALLEWVLRQRVQQITNVRFLLETEVTGLMSSDDLQKVTGVYTKERSEKKTENSVTADMVVVTAGRSSKVIKWLESLGHEVPAPEILKVSIGYSTRYYKIPPQLDDEWRSVLSEAQPHEGIGTGMLLRIEDNIAGSLLFSAGGAHYPSIDAVEYQEELKHITAKGIADFIQTLEPLQGPRGYRTPESVRYHFEQMKEWPSGFLVLGDAFCSFDPIHGQGMTVAAIEAETIGTCLEEHCRNPYPEFERHVLQRMQQAIEPAWWLSSVADLRWNGVEHIGSEPLIGVAFAQKYIDLYTKRAMKLAEEQNDNSLYVMLFMMNALVLPPSEIFNAQVLKMLLNDENSQEEQQLRAELLEQDPKKFQTRIEQLIPSFKGAFNERMNEELISMKQQSATES